MIRNSDDALTSAAYWYPLIKSAGLPVPETIFVHYPFTTGHGNSELWHLLDGEKPQGYEWFKQSLHNAVVELGGYPAFIRTEMSSDKHDWKNSCFVESEKGLDQCIGMLTDHSAMHDLQMTFWMVRKLIATKPITTAFHGDMPIARERRVFAAGGKMICQHPYWPDEAFQHETMTDKLRAEITELQSIDDDSRKLLQQMAEYVSNRIPDAWSIDFLQDEHGAWWLIDMALAKSSYHWNGCKYQSMQEIKNLITGEVTHAGQNNT